MVSRPAWLSFVAVALVVGGCSTEPLEGDDEALERVEIEVNHDALTLPGSLPGGGLPIGSCSGAMPACGCGGFRICALGSWGSCIYPPEKCNGVDDDCDGQVDEGGDALCADTTACTTAERCSTLSFMVNGVEVRNTTCTAGVNHALCDDRIGCTTDRCAPSAAGRDDAGCTHAPVDAQCSDGCSCTGREVCAPGTAGANAVTGCKRGPAPCERDGNVCTINACCESLTAACRATLGTNAAAFENACAFATGDRVVAETGATVTCPGASTQLPCDDGNPCTREIGCSATTGCLRQNVPDYTVITSMEQGCVVDICIGGRLDRRNVTTETAAILRVPAPTCGSAQGSCGGRSCQPISGGSACLPNAALCDDGIFCNGPEVCDVFDRAPLRRANGTYTPRGCETVSYRRPCLDGSVCTDDVCNEATRVCSFPWRSTDPNCFVD